MITLRDILNSQSDILEGKRVKLVRHKDSRAEYRDVIKDKDKLLAYQRTQPKHVFKGCDYIVSFIGIERSQAVLFNVFEVRGHTEINGEYEYDLYPVSGFENLVDRLVIDWGNNTISWHQWYDRHDKRVVSILPEGYIGHFPGLLDFVLEFDELHKMTMNPEANHEWFTHLSSINGVYLILDSKTGNQYIGSACGKQGIWQRWTEYVKTKTGGNKQLVKLLKQDPAYHKNFRYSVLQTLPSNITRQETIKVEQLYKEKLGSRAHGLNDN